MILRKQKIKNNSDNVQMFCSFGLADVKALMRLYASMCASIKDEAHAETDVRNWLEADGRAFLSWPTKWRKQLSAWCFATAVRNNLLLPTAIGDNMYFLADFLFTKRGRPRKDEDE